MTCRHWKRYLKGMDMPICAFDSKGRFKPNNWNCWLMNRLRDMCESTSIFNYKEGGLPAIYNNDQYCSTIPFEDKDGRAAYALLFWYKGRGKTEAFHVAEMGYTGKVDTWNIRLGMEADVNLIVKQKKVKK